jgi:N-acetyl sugar amidotransferase
MDSSVPDISFDANGECNYCKLHEHLVSDNPNNEEGTRRFTVLTEAIKRKGKNRKYDVVVGVSGGTDSTFLCHLAKSYGLRVLAVHLDCGWDSEIAVSNIKSCIEKLGIDLYTYVVDWEEIRDIYRSAIKAAIPWPDGVTDTAILGSLYKVANVFNIPYIFVGNNFRTEGRQPDAWTDFDSRVMRSAHRKFGSGRRKTFPDFTPFHIFYYGFIKGIKMVRPFYYLDYSKADAKKVIAEQYGWRDYGGHHHESIFTRYIIGVWLPSRFKIDKRKVTYSAAVRSGHMTRTEALQQLSRPPYDPKKMEEDKVYIAKKLLFSEDEFERLLQLPIKSHQDYPNYQTYITPLRSLLAFLFTWILPWKPMMLYDPKNYDTDVRTA